MQANHVVRRVDCVFRRTAAAAGEHVVQRVMACRVVRQAEEEGIVVQRAVEAGNVVQRVAVRFLVLNEPVEFVTRSAVEDCATRFLRPEVDSGVRLAPAAMDCEVRQKAEAKLVVPPWVVLGVVAEVERSAAVVVPGVSRTKTTSARSCPKIRERRLSFHRHDHHRCRSYNGG